MPTTTTSSSSFLFLSFLLLLLIFSASAHSGHHDEDEESSSLKESDLRSASLILVKIWCLIIMFIGTFVGGVSPYFFKWNEGFLVLGTQFAGGVFLGTALMHFLSDSNETFKDLTSKEYPFAFMLASFGYLITMLADVVISYVYDKEKSVPAAAAVAGGGGGGDVDDVELQGLTEPQGKATSNGKSSQSSSSADDGHGVHFANPNLTNASSLGDSILLIVALCSHSIFEGIAIGIAETKADAWRALWTVSLHKVFAAIAMGIALLRIIPDRPLFSCASYAFAFAISSPIGVAIGIVIDATTQGEVADWIYAISMSLACGVFIYVSINHLLSKGYTPLKATLVDKAHYKFLAVMLGIGVIAIVMIWD